MLEYVRINREAWNKKVELHYASEFYAVNDFIEGRCSLKLIEKKLLGELRGKSVLHLQCHFGQDTLSLNRLGAEVVGVDFSDEAIKKANELNEVIHGSARFICCDIYDLHHHLNEKFDIVFSSYGTIGWLPNLDLWAEQISRFLKPDGKFIFVEFHPVVWMFDDEFARISYNYFNEKPYLEKNIGSYANRQSEIQYETVFWNHGLGEVVGSLLSKEIQIVNFEEHDYSPYNCFQGMEELEPGKFRISKFGRKLPLVYSLVGKRLNK